MQNLNVAAEKRFVLLLIIRLSTNIEEWNGFIWNPGSERSGAFPETVLKASHLLTCILSEPMRPCQQVLFYSCVINQLNNPWNISRQENSFKWDMICVHGWLLRSVMNMMGEGKASRGHKSKQARLSNTACSDGSVPLQWKTRRVTC